MNEIKSIWDGWEKQCFDAGTDFNDAYCARGFLALGYAQVHPAEPRIAAYLRANYPIPETYVHPAGHRLSPLKVPQDAVIYANNVLKLTPEDFRRIDRETQIEEALKAVERVSQVTPELALTPAIQRGGE